MGGGHDGVANEIANRLTSLGVICTIRDFLDASPRMGRLLEEAFHIEVEQAPWAYRIEFELWNRSRLLTAFTRRFFEAFFARQVVAWIEKDSPDLIIALHPFPAQLLGQMRRKRYPVLKDIPICTYLTDFSVHPLWVHPAIDVHLCVADTAAVQARRRAGASGQVVTVGPFVPKRFFHPIDKNLARRELNLPDDSTVVLISSGSWGVGNVLSTYRILAASEGITPVLLCGHNRALLAKARKVTSGVAVSWTTEITKYLSASDVVVQNAGGLTALEAMAANRPVVSYQPIAGHGIDNTQTMVEAGVTVWPKTSQELIETIRNVADHPEKLTRQASQLFKEHPEQAILALLHGEPKSQASFSYRKLRQAAKVATSVAAVFVMANIVSGLIGYKGLNLAAATDRSRYVYLTALASPSTINSGQFLEILKQDNVSLVVTAKDIEANPSGINNAFASGVSIVNGGTSSPNSDFNLLLPANDLASTRAMLYRLLDVNINLYIPQNTINAVDLAWAGIHHQSVIPAHITAPDINPSSLRLHSGEVIELNLTRATTYRSIRFLYRTLKAFEVQGFRVAPIDTISTQKVITQ
jgi:UDP-N-acetylglucosamine:LPS N-acetylglucosamine transferase